MTGYGALPAPPVDNALPNFRLAELVALIQNRQRLILHVTIGTVVAAVLLALALPTVWSSSAVVLMDQRRNNVTDISAVLSQLPGDPTTLQNQIQILTSRELAGKVIDRLGLARDPEFNPQLARPGPVQIAGEIAALFNPRNWNDDGAALDNNVLGDRLTDNFARHVTAEANGLSTAITLTVTSRDPVKAARIANALAGAYIGEQVDVKRGATDATTIWLNQRIHDLSQQLQIQEGAVESYKARHGLTDTAPGNSLVDQQLVGINAQVVQARSDVAEKQAAYDRVNQLAASGDAADVSAVVSSPLIVQLRTQEAQLLRDEGDLQSKYGPLHPKLQALEEQKRDLDTKIADEVRRLTAASGNDLAVAKAHLQSLEQSLGGARGELTSQNYARVQLQALEANAASTRAQYEAFVGRLRQTQDQNTIATPESRIISPAAVPLNPSAPRRTLIVAASLPLGLLLGLLVALCAEKWRTLQPLQIKGVPRAAMIAPRGLGVPAMPPRPARAKPRSIPIPTPVWQGPPILADIHDSASLKAGEDMLQFPKSAYAHHMAALVRQLESRPVNGQKSAAAVVAVTAAEAGENKSAIGVSLARAATLMGKKTLLVDCDPAQTAATAMKASGKAGLYDVLTGAVPLSKALSKDACTNAHVLTMRKRPPDLTAMLGSGQMTRLIDVLRAGCDMVVIDCGRAGAGAEAALLARLADATLLVSRQGGLFAPSLAHSVNILSSAKAAPIGIVVTR
jgi:uncharacterized protein involved in exopolysaccharide biosynthesis/Mrp family chromosome partitioning ATPase